MQNGALATPDTASDLLEGINRRMVLEIARDLQIPVVERSIDLTELYVADEVFACGTSTFVAPVIEIDARVIGDGAIGPITQKLKAALEQVVRGADPAYAHYVSVLSGN
jgi:branched-chain amino acid aminotransferase